MCKEGCGSCLYKVEKEVPYCGHNVTIECSSHPSTSNCKVKNVKLLDCGHSCLLTCYEIQNDVEYICKEKVLKKLECGHEKYVFCDSEKRFLCNEMVKKTFFDCNHTLDIECYKSKDFNCTELIFIP